MSPFVGGLLVVVWLVLRAESPEVCQRLGQS